MNQRYMKNHYDRCIYTAYVQYFLYIVYTILCYGNGSQFKYQHDT